MGERDDYADHDQPPPRWVRVALAVAACLSVLGVLGALAALGGGHVDWILAVIDQLG